MTSLYTSLAASRRCRMTHAMLKYATTDLHLQIVNTNEIPDRIIERQKQLSTRDSNENLECVVTSLYTIGCVTLPPCDAHNTPVLTRTRVLDQPIPQTGFKHTNLPPLLFQP